MSEPVTPPVTEQRTRQAPMDLLPAGPATASVGSGTVSFAGVSRWFGDTVALSDVSFSLAPGVTGLLGHNGAGKSTALSLLGGFVPPSEGRVRVLGRDPFRDSGVFEVLGVVSDADGLWDFLSVRDVVLFLASQRGVSAPGVATSRALGRVGLLEVASARVSSLSKGMRQRVRLAQALVHDPEVLLLDEPLNGLDPLQRRLDVDLVVSLGLEGRTVLVSSHLLHEVERMASTLLVMVDGRLVAEGTSEGIRDLLSDRPRTVRVRATGARALGVLLLQEEGVSSVGLEVDGSLLVQGSSAAALSRCLPVLAARAGTVLERVEPVGEDLDSVFSALTSRSRGVAR